MLAPAPKRVLIEVQLPAELLILYPDRVIGPGAIPREVHPNLEGAT